MRRQRTKQEAQPCSRNCGRMVIKPARVCKSCQKETRREYQRTHQTKRAQSPYLKPEPYREEVSPEQVARAEKQDRAQIRTNMAIDKDVFARSMEVGVHSGLGLRRLGPAAWLVGG